MLRLAFLRLPLLVILSGLTGFAMFVPAIHARLASNHAVAQDFFYSAIVILVFTGLVAIAASNWVPRNVAQSQLVSLVVAYVWLPVLFALPLVQIIPSIPLEWAWFEMVSSFTTTGATLLESGTPLPPTVHLWRAMVGWLGGFFFLVAASAILAPLNLGGAEVLSGQSGQRRSDAARQIVRVADPSERLLRFALVLFPFYAGLTLLLWLLLMMAGEVNLVALIHAMSTLSTSGIGPEGNLSVLRSGFWGEFFIFLFLCLTLSRRTMPGQGPAHAEGPIWRDPELRLALSIVAAVTTILFLRHWFAAYEERAADDVAASIHALWGIVFTVLSFLTTTGFESAGWESAQSWSGLASPGLVLAGLAIMGGGVATTAGGVKLLRVYALGRHGLHELDRLVHPSSILGGGAEGRRLVREGAFLAWVFFILFTLSILFGTTVLTLFGPDFETALILCISALTTTGQLVELATDQALSFASLSQPAQVFAAFLMVVGRLETLAILAVLSPSLFRK